MPVWLLWLMPVLLAVPLAVAWSSWTSRTRRPVRTADSVEAYERFRRALARPVAQGHPRPLPKD